MVKKTITMTIDENVLNDFKSYCRQNGMKLSTRVELLMLENVKAPERRIWKFGIFHVNSCSV